ncbi:MAG: hypothetical protein NT062_15830 [Proteobacteria bacterium]|nr:hypothetical protein [Pseudomonadota bacterium]
MIIEAEVRAKASCDGSPTTNVTVLAKIERPSVPTACPIGELALRVGPDIEDRVMPAFLDTLARDRVAEAARALRRFADAANESAAEAFVVKCTGTSADWLFVQTVPRGEGRPQVALFVNNELRLEPTRPLVVPLAAVAATIPTAPPRTTGDCTEPIDPSATRWIGRALSTGVMPGPSRLETYVLARAQDRATVIMQSTSATNPTPPAAYDLPTGAWRCDRSTTLTGTVVERNKELVLRLAEASSPTVVHEVICTRRRLAVVGADAVRVPIASRMEGCNAHRWVPAGTTTRNALSCVSHDTTWGHFQNEVFLGDAPGIEHVTLDNDDCGDPTSALRALRKGNGVATVRKASTK